MKYTGLKNQLIALRNQLPPRNLVLRISGGLPPGAEQPKPLPPGHELKTQHKAFAQPAQAVAEPASASDVSKPSHLSPPWQKALGGLPRAV